MNWIESNSKPALNRAKNGKGGGREGRGGICNASSSSNEKSNQWTVVNQSPVGIELRLREPGPEVVGVGRRKKDIKRFKWWKKFQQIIIIIMNVLKKPRRFDRKLNTASRNKKDKDKDKDQDQTRKKVRHERIRSQKRTKGWNFVRKQLTARKLPVTYSVIS